MANLLKVVELAGIGGSEVVNAFGVSGVPVHFLEAAAEKCPEKGVRIYPADNGYPRSCCICALSLEVWRLLSFQILCEKIFVVI